MRETHFKARVRAVIVDTGELLTVRLSHDPSYACLPGGGLEHGEGLVEGLERELVEELGVRPVVGDLLYVYSWVSHVTHAHNLEYFFEIKNAPAYRYRAVESPTHAHEIAEIVWTKPNDAVVVKPQFIRERLDTHNLWVPKTVILGPE